ncbi:MAG: FAD-dependent oxidoreductase [Gammaproteobacteria bacterium]
MQDALLLLMGRSLALFAAESRRSGREPMQLPQVVIVGGGFGGLWATRAMARSLVEITLVDRQNYHLFQPLLSGRDRGPFAERHRLAYPPHPSPPAQRSSAAGRSHKYRPRPPGGSHSWACASL